MALGELSFAFDPSKDTPATLARKRALAEAILGETSHAPRDIGEGLNAVGQAILYRRLMGGVDKGEAEGASGASKVFNSLFGDQFPAAPTAASPAASNATSADTGTGDMSPYRNAIASIESAGSGDYGAIGPTHKTMGRALGRYQVMEANLGPWSQAALGRTVTPDEFLASPQIQDAVFDHEFGKYLKEYGNPQDAASMWFTGVPASQGGNRKDVLGTTGNAYVAKFNNALGGTAPASAPTQVASLDPGAGLPSNDPYRLIPAVDSRGEDQRAKFRQWNSDPIGNEAANMASIDPALAKVVERAQQIAGTKFVIGAGKRTPEMQQKAVDWGWSKTLDSDHLGGGAADLWPIDANGAVVFDPQKQQQIVAAMKQAAKEQGVDLESGADWKKFRDVPHFGLVGQTPMQAPVPTARPDGVQVASLDPSIGMPAQANSQAPQPQPNPLAAAMANLPIAAERLPTASRLPAETNNVGDMLPSPFALGSSGNPIPQGGLPYVQTPEQLMMAGDATRFPPGMTPQQKIATLLASAAPSAPAGLASQGATDGIVSPNGAELPVQRVAAAVAPSAKGDRVAPTTNPAAQRILAAMLNKQSMTGGDFLPFIPGSTPAPAPEQTASVNPPPLPGKTVADMPVAGNTQAQQDAVDLNALPVEAGGNGGAIQPGTNQGPSLNQLMQAAANPWLSEGQRSVVNAMIEQKMKENDPSAALDRRYKEAQIAALENPQAKPTADMQEYEFAKSQGFQGTFQDYQVAMKQAGRQETNVNVDAKGETEYDKGMGKALADKTISIIDAGQAANGKIATYQQMLDVLPGIYTGAGGDTLLTGKRIAKGLGLDVGDLSGPEFVQAMGNQMALELRNPAGGAGMPGAMSDSDRAFLASMSPGLTKTPEGNKTLLEYRMAVENRNLEVAKLANDYMNTHNGRLDNNFFADLAKWSEANPIFPKTATGPAAAAPKKPIVLDGYTIEEVP